MRIPSGNNTTFDCDVIVYRVYRQCAGMRERFAVLHGVGVREKEVADRRYNFIPDQRIKMPDLECQAVANRNINIGIRLRECQLMLIVGIQNPANEAFISIEI